MKYTSDNISIDEYSYGENALSIFYYLNNDPHKMGRLLPDSGLMRELQEVGAITKYDLVLHEVKIDSDHSCMGLETFMESKLTWQLVEKLVLNYLNNKTEKP